MTLKYLHLKGLPWNFKCRAWIVKEKKRWNKKKNHLHQIWWSLATQVSSLKRQHQHSSNIIVQGSIWKLDGLTRDTLRVQGLCHQFFLIIFIYIKSHNFPKLTWQLQNSLSAKIKMSLGISYGKSNSNTGKSFNYLLKNKKTKTSLKVSFKKIEFEGIKMILLCIIKTKRCNCPF